MTMALIILHLSSGNWSEEHLVAGSIKSQTLAEDGAGLDRNRRAVLSTGKCRFRRV